MPTNKQALIRYRYLDKLLSDQYHYYDIRDLKEKVNDKLSSDGFPTVTLRTIQKDIDALESSPYNAVIRRFRENGRIRFRYANSGFSIFREELSQEEAILLEEVLNTLGQFDGLEHFKWLQDFKLGLHLKKRRQIISFSNNPDLKNSNLLGTIFDYISNEVVIRLSYHTYADYTVRSIDFHPYLLKQYNDRWFLLGAADSDKKILTFALDRIDYVKLQSKKQYEKCPANLAKHFDNIVGVTLYEDRPMEHIIFWVSNGSKGYVATKPIHRSQRRIIGGEEKHLREQYPQLEEGTIFTIDCVHNYELIRELCSFGKDLIVLEPSVIQKEILSRIQDMMKDYELVINH